MSDLNEKRLEAYRLSRSGKSYRQIAEIQGLSPQSTIAIRNRIRQGKRLAAAASDPNFSDETTRRASMTDDYEGI